MKNLLIAALCLIISSQIHSQENDSKWSLGIQAGVNALRISRIPVDNSFSLFKSKSSERILAKKRYSFQIRGVAKYDLSKRTKFITGLGITHAKASATRTSTSSNTNILPIFFGGDAVTNSTTRRDTVNFNYTLIDIPFALRWQIIPEESTKYNFKMYMDFGINMNIPIASKSSVGVGHSSSKTSETSHTSKSLELNNISFFYSIGFLAGENSTIEWRWQRMRTKQDSKLYKSSLRSIVVTRYF